jgi:ABC-type uncharacterized transport system permease subunit
MPPILTALLTSVADVFLPVLYAVTVLLYGQAFFRKDDFAKTWKSRFLVATSALHTLSIGLHTKTAGHCMVTTPFEIMSLVAYTIVMTYTVIEIRTKVKGTGFFMTGTAGLFAVASAVMTRVAAPAPNNPVLSEPVIGLHVSAAIFGTGALAVSAVYGVLYLVLYRDLKRGSFGSAYQHLPSLESLERLSIAATVVGFAFTTVAMLIGILWLPRVYQHFSYFDPKLVATALVWLLYAVVIVARYALRLDGRRVIVLSLGGFVLAVLSLTLVNALLSSFHRF